MIIITLFAAAIVAVLEPPSRVSVGRAVPTITAIKPGQVYVGQASFTLIVRGTEFTHNAVIRWNGSDLPTIYDGESQLRATIAATELAAVRTVQITVFVQGGNGGLSNAVPFRVVNPPPTITATKPGQVWVGQPDMRLIVRGTNFTQNAVIRWNGSDLPTTYDSEDQLRTTVAATELAAVRTVQVTVFVPDGGLSNASPFTVINPPPTIASLTPSSATVGGQAFTLVVDGSNFVAGASIRWNGVARTTTVVSSTRLTARVTTADLIRGPVQVTVANPQPGGGTSTGLALSMTEPTPTPVPVSPTPASVDAVTSIPLTRVPTMLPAVDSPPDLEVKVTQAASTVVPGTQQTYSVKVYNRGDVIARAILLRAALPPDLEYVSTGGDHYFACARSGTMLSCPSGVIAGHDTANIVVTMRLPLTATSGRTLLFGVTVDPDWTILESNEYNNSASATAMTQAVRRPAPP